MSTPTIPFRSGAQPTHRIADGVIAAAIVIAFAEAVVVGTQYGNLFLAGLLGGALCLAGLAVWRFAPGTLLSRCVLTATLMALVALHIQLGRGTLELHFGVFVALGLLLVYLDWRPIVLGAGLIAVHHVVFDRLQAAGVGVYCAPTPSFFKMLLHAGYVVAQTSAEVVIAVTMHKVARSSAQSSAELGDTLGRMRATVELTRESAANVGAAAGEIARGNVDLRQRTERTAGQLQNANASLAQLTASVQGGAVAAADVNRLALVNAGTAEKGGARVRQVVAKMNDISASSRRIGEITGVIDGIAFQTNILALNAAVEAARAGDHGRGFAVVASEVRALSQRSAAAAREIKDLIEASVADVESGSRLVDEAGSDIGAIVAGSGRVAQLVQALCQTAAEQSVGVVEVGRTVTAVDEMTRENAALVQQGAVAAETLREQAARLSAVSA